MKLKVYFNNSKLSTKDHTRFFEEFSEVLKKVHNTEVFAYEDPVMYIEREGITVKFLECEMFIDVNDGESYRFISFCDTDPGASLLFQKRNNPSDVLLHAQHNSPCSRFWNIANTCNFKLSGFVYPSFQRYLPEKLEEYYQIRQQKTAFIDKFFFRGNIGPMGRNSPVELQKSEWFAGCYGVDTNKYFEELVNYKIGLSIPGIGEMCHRDVEYLALGIPYLKCVYDTNLNPPLRPDYHYIAVPRIGTRMEEERSGGPEFAQAYLKRFLEVKDDFLFLRNISKNAREYYEKYLHPNVRINHTLSLVGL